MKKKYTLFVMLTLIIHSGVFAQQDSTCPPDLLHYWKFDEEDSLKFTDYVGGLDALVIDETTIIQCHRICLVTTFTGFRGAHCKFKCYCS